MSQVDVGKQQARVLRQLIEEARQAPPPPVDFDRIQARLLQQVEAEKQWQKPRSRGRESYGTLAAFAAVAAAVVMVIAGQGSETSAPAEHARFVDLSTLHSAQAANDALPTYRVEEKLRERIVASGDEPLKFELVGVAVWTLAPHSRVRVRTTSMPHEIVLEQGAVHAEVVPRHSSEQLIESFVVEAGTTRVAVHGTVFSVSREAERVVVDVSRGIVTVGPAGHRGPTTGRLLVGPARATFALTGGELLANHEPPLVAAPAEVAEIAAKDAPESDETDAAPAPVAEERVPLAGALSVRSASAQGPAEQAPSAPETSRLNPQTADEPPASSETAAGRLSVDQARAVVVACLNSLRGSGDSSDRRVTVSSTVQVSLDDDGAVQSVQFNPPLRPDLQQRCGGALLGNRLALSGRQGSFRVHFATR